MAVDEVLCRDQYITLSREDFNEVCPRPEALVHVVSPIAGVAVRELCRELSGVDGSRWGGMVAYIEGAGLTMDQLGEIVGALPAVERTRKGLGFGDLDGSGVEVWIFLESV